MKEKASRHDIIHTSLLKYIGSLILSVMFNFCNKRITLSIFIHVFLLFE